eukprot:1393523-Amorphochlora_amoeboformis.AAC.1
MALTGFILVLSTVEMTVHPSLCLTYKKKPHWVKPWDRPGGFGRQRTREAQKLRFFMEFQRQCKKSTAQIARIESRQERNRSATHPRLNSTKSSHHRRNSTSSRPFNATSSTDAPKSPKKPRRLPTRIGATTNHYAVLEIPFNASDQDVSRAFRRMSVRYHPDKLRRAGQERINATDAKAKFLSIKTAFDVLSSSKRHKYNHELADAITRVEGSDGNTQDSEGEEAEAEGSSGGGRKGGVEVGVAVEPIGSVRHGLWRLGRESDCIAW